MKKKNLIFAVSFLIFVLGCQPTRSSPTTIATPTGTLVPTLIPTSTANLIPTATLTLTPIPPTSNPNLILGNWAGILSSEAGFQIQVDVSITDDCSRGSVCGVITYSNITNLKPSFSCRGNLFLEKVENQTVIFIEEIEVKCQSMDNGFYHLRLLEDKTLLVNYYFSDGKAGSSGILKRP